MGAFRLAIEDVNRNDPFLARHPALCEFLHHDDSTRQSPQIPVAMHMCGVLYDQGGQSQVHPGPFACDMRHLVNQGGIPSIIFGPGTIAQAHKPDEHIDLGEYLDSIACLIEFIATWCNMEAETPLPGDCR